MKRIPKLIQGNLLHANEDIIVHQVNCLGIIGTGLDNQIKQLYPEVYKAYNEFIALHETPHDLLGKNLVTTTEGRIPDTSTYTENAKYISNLFGQLNMGCNQTQTNYKAFQISMLELYEFATSNELTVAIPYGIGCGFAGGDWKTIHDIIMNVFHDYPVSIYKTDA